MKISAELVVSLMLIARAAAGLAHTHLVIPCYNEELRLPSEAFLSFIDEQEVEAFLSYTDSDPPVHFLFVDDGSTDGTVTLLRRLRDQRPSNVALLELGTNRGKAEATRLGMLEALKSVRSVTQGALDHSESAVGFWDGDLATPLDALAEFVEVLDNDPEVRMVFGARVGMLGRNIQRQLDRHYLGRVFATLASTLLGLRIYDTQCGAKLFRVTEDLQAVLAEPFGSAWVFDVELIARFAALHRNDAGATAIAWGGGRTDGKPRLPIEKVVYEIPLREWRDIAGSKVKFSAKIGALSGLFGIWKRHYSPWRSWPGLDSERVLAVALKSSRPTESEVELKVDQNSDDL